MLCVSSNDPTYNNSHRRILAAIVSFICGSTYEPAHPSECSSLTSALLCGRSAVKFPDVAGSVIQLLMDFLGDTSTASALDVIFFVREIVETNEKLRPAILARLLDSFTQIRSSRVRCLRPTVTF